MAPSTKAFREVTGMDEEHYPKGHPPPPHGPGGRGRGPPARSPMAAGLTRRQPFDQSDPLAPWRPSAA